MAQKMRDTNPPSSAARPLIGSMKQPSNQRDCCRCNGARQRGPTLAMSITMGWSPTALPKSSFTRPKSAVVVVKEGGTHGERTRGGADR